MDQSDFCFNCLCTGTVPAYNIIREGYHIEGSAWTDMIFGCCCVPCAAIQLLNETESRGPLSTQFGGDGAGGPFRNPLFGCTKDINTCCMALCCPCILSAQTRGKYDGSAFCFNCLCIPVALSRNIIREGYNVQGSCCEDVLLSCLCGICVLSQLSYEVADRGQPGQAAVAVVVGQAVVAQPGAIVTEPGKV